MKIMTLVFGFILGELSFAYIPDYQMIMSRVAENNGRGSYFIEQEVVFPGDPEPFRVKETWVIKGEYDMSLELEGLGPLKGLISGRLVYEQTNKYFLSQGTARKVPLTQDWWQPFFHFRYSKNIKPRLVHLQIAPPESLQERRPFIQDKKMVYPPQSFLRLARAEGVINYAVGTPTPTNSSKDYPGLWIEQDLFLIRKLRLPSEVLITADEYARYPRYQWLPKKTEVQWGEQNQVQIQLTQVEALSPSDKRNEALNLRSLPASKSDLKLPDHAGIREFYQRFR